MYEEDYDLEEGEGFDLESEMQMMFPEDDGEPDDGFSIDCLPWDND